MGCPYEQKFHRPLGIVGDVCGIEHRRRLGFVTACDIAGRKDDRYADRAAAHTYCEYGTSG